MKLPIRKREKCLNHLTRFHEETDDLFGNFFEDRAKPEKVKSNSNNIRRFQS